MVLLLTTAALLGFIAGSSYLSVLQKCSQNPYLCNHSNSWTWDAGPGTAVSTAEGHVKGTFWNSRMGRRFHVFLGMPYGQVYKRFEAAWPYPRWDGVRDARMYGQPCTQLDRKTQVIIGSENCLFLNVFTPQMQPHLLPVMVWIDSSLGWQYGHGGNIDPRNFMDENVVLVTFNSRQSALGIGFLSTGDGEIQGNMGLKDQLLALQWVQRNIHNFGGDRSRVTIFGQDSGAASVHFHMLSPLSKGMFHRAISQSGSAHCPWALQRNAAAKAKMLASMLNCDLANTRAMADCMRSRSDREILEAELKMKLQNWNGEPYAMFGPTVESYAYKSQAFMPDTPRNLIKTGQMEKVPWIIGWNEQEGRYFVPKVLNSESMTNMINNEWTRIAPISFFYDDVIPDTSMKSTVSSKIMQHYFNSNRIGRESWENYTSIYTDRLYMAGIAESIMAHSSMTQVYPYLFKYRGDHSYTDMIYGSYDTRYAPSHFDELHYLFNWEWTKDYQMKGATPSWEISSKFVKLWVSFAETGVPSSTWGTQRVWNPSSPIDSAIKWYTLDYDTHVLMDDSVFQPRLEMWRSLGIQDDRML